MIYAAIVEDEKQSAKKLGDFLTRFSKEKNEEVNVVRFPNAVDFLSDYNAKFDVVFMDIEMPHLNGMDAAKELRRLDQNVCLVFVTNMVQYAVKGYEVDAMGYMVKPIDYFAFSLLMDKVSSRIKSRASDELMVKDGDRVKRLFVSDVRYVEVTGHYIVYHTKDGDFSELGQLGKLEEKLADSDFFRCNNCYLVNLKYVSEVNENDVKIGDDVVLMSRRRRKDFLIALNKYFGRVNS